MNSFRHRYGFTLIEIIVVVGVIALALPALFSVLFVVLQQQVKVTRLNEVKKEGDAVLQLVEAKIKDNAQTIWGCADNLQCDGPENPITTICTSGTPPDNAGYVKKFNWASSGPNNNWFAFLPDGENSSIQYITSSGITTITSPKVIVDFLSFSVTCNKKSTYSNPTVTLSFNICYRTNGNYDSCSNVPPEDLVQLTYRTNIVLRKL